LNLLSKKQTGQRDCAGLFGLLLRLFLFLYLYLCLNRSGSLLIFVSGWLGSFSHRVLEMTDTITQAFAQIPKL
jgi:hypothetical protein